MDAEGNILVDHPTDLLKLEHIIDFMRQHDVGAWLLQETWEEGDEFDVDIGGYHIFWHNALRSENGRQTSSKELPSSSPQLFTRRGMQQDHSPQ